MVAGTGEAPSGVVEYDRDNLPDDYRGTLLVTSWGDHRIEHYRLRPHGASFRATMKPVVAGGDDFRPVGIAIAPDGSVYISDWVDKSYTLHGKGRIWRLRASGVRTPIAWLESQEGLSHGPDESRLHWLRPRGHGKVDGQLASSTLRITIRPTCVRWAVSILPADQHRR